MRSAQAITVVQQYYVGRQNAAFVEVRRVADMGGVEREYDRAAIGPLPGMHPGQDFRRIIDQFDQIAVGDLAGAQWHQRHQDRDTLLGEPGPVADPLAQENQ